MRKTSIRGKITAGFLLSFSFLLLVASVMFASLHVVEDEVGAYSGISRFLDTTLEMRRYEKNFLLYGKREDLERAVEYAGAASALAAEGALGGTGAARHPAWLRLLAGQGAEVVLPEGGATRTIQLLEAYRTLLGEAGANGSGAEPAALALATAIRDTGRSITDVAERLSSAEGRNIQEMLRSARRTLIVLVVLFLAGNALIARVIVLTALRPLRELERGMQQIAGGHYEPLPEGSGHDEIGSMNAAFNRMIRELFEHEQEVIQSARLASLGTALAGIAHELNNPLSNVSTSAELLREEHERATPAERRELIDQIVAETDRATDIIRTVLDVSREPRADHRAANLLATVRGSLILARGAMPEHVRVEVDVPPDVEVHGDKTRLEQAFINLVTNAVDAMRDPARESRIHVAAARRDGRVEIVFRDTGAGIPRDRLDRIFDPFFTTKDVGQGTGLGLYLTHQIVEQHGGTIRVESEVGAGTQVVMTLPSHAPGQVSSGSQTDHEEPG